MDLTHSSCDPDLYDLALVMAGEARPHPLAVEVLQRLLAYTGSAAAAVLQQPASGDEGPNATAQIYATVGSPGLHALEGKTVAWPAAQQAEEDADVMPVALPAEMALRHVLAFQLPGFGHLLLFSPKRPTQIGQFRQRLAPFLTRFADRLRHDLESEANARALAKARDDAEAAVRAKSLFLSSMSHELRTPLNAILGHAQLIAMQPGLPEAIVSSAEDIQQAGASLLSQLHGMLELAGIGSGSLDLKIEPLVPAEVLEDCLAANAATARFMKAPLNCTNACEQCRIAADRHVLHQALNQLVGNALKHNRVDGEVSLICCTMGDERVRLSVSDEGRGIAPDLLPHLFEPFNRIGAEGSPVMGTGVGLAITRRLVEAMGGCMGVDSTPEHGSTFWIELPTAYCLDDTDAASSPLAPPASCLQGARILVAEDYPPNQTLLRMQLAALGCDADIVPDGAAALAAWSAGHYDLILADLNMPVMDGLELARAVREREATRGTHTPILSITAADLPSETRQCLEAGMDDTLLKPVVLETLRARLERWLGTRPVATPPESDATDDAILDLTCLYDVLGEANEGIARELVATFIHAATSGLGRVAGNASHTAVAQEMHKQKSSARAVGALRYARLATTLEALARQGGGDFRPSLSALRDALEEIKSVHARLAVPQRVEAGSPGGPLAESGAMLVVDDDPVVRQQMTAMLHALGVKEVQTASDGLAALRLLRARNGGFDTVVCDLSMPAMDGVELLRQFGAAGFQGGVILMSGADEKVLNTAGKLADLQGLRVLGQVRKPATAGQLTGLLSRSSVPPTRRRHGASSLEVSPQSIRDGMARDEFTVWFQPKVDAFSLEPVGVEALARWHHPTQGLLFPDAFIGVAEREGLVAELSQILTSRALMEGARLHDAGFPLSIAINLSGLWLDELGLPDFIHATTQAAGLRPANVVLEVTETGVMKELATALEVLTRLRLKGFGLSIDDFGIGYSSFEQLDRIPFTELKLDRSFVNKGAADATAHAILQGSIDMARQMVLTTVAEGVETESELELMRALGCDHIQGYLIARPMPTSKLIDWLRNRQNPAHQVPSA